MFGALFNLARPLLHWLDPEQAHELTLRALEAGGETEGIVKPHSPQLDR